jgi:hypothetical protein
METIETSEIERVRRDSASLLNNAMNLAVAIKDDSTLSEAAHFLLEIKAFRKGIADKFEPSVSAARDAWKKILAVRDEIDAPLEKAEKDIVKPAMAKYHSEADRKRRKQEEEETARRVAEEEDARLAEAAALETSGKKAEADQVLSTPVAVAPVVLPKPVKTKGVSYPLNWYFKISNPALVPRQYLMVDEKMIGAYVQAMKDKAAIPGVEVYSEESVAVRS